MKDDKDPEQKSTLGEDDIEVSERSLGRRAVVRAGGVAAASSAVALATGCGRRRVVRIRTVSTGITDRDAGPQSDPAGHGRGGGGTGITDRDAGPQSDPSGYGRGGGGTGITDSDRGPCSDPGGGGRGHSGITDSDGGPCSDPGGRGRHGY